MNRFIKKCFFSLPQSMQNQIIKLCSKLKYFKKLKTLMKYYEDEQDLEIRETIQFIKNHGINMLLNEACLKYRVNNVEVHKDKDLDLFFVMHNNKRLYFKRSLCNEKMVVDCYNTLCAEQDEKSPHRYMADFISNRKIFTFADIGAAEGILALELIETLDKVYLFECEAQWIEALLATFKPYEDKVVIVQKYVADITDNDMITLDDYFYGKEIGLIKMDIEGAEIRALKGAKKLLNQETTMFMVCAYHKADHEGKIKQIFNKYNYTHETSTGYILNDWKQPYFRRGVIRAKPMERNL